MFILIVASLSLALYDNRKIAYTLGKEARLGSTPSFSFVHRYIQASTIICTLGGSVFHDRIFLDMHDSTLILYCGVGITTVGILLFVHSKMTLGRNYSPCFDSYLPHCLTTTGVYGYVRHPIYVSNLLLLLGAFIMSGSAWIIVNLFLAGAFYYSAAIQEERDLCIHVDG